MSFDPQVKGLRVHGGGYYDFAFRRWLPVARAAVSPDGKHYAFGDPAPDQSKAPTIHVVDVATGIDHVFKTPSTEWFVPYIVLDYAVDGIYLTQAWESPRFGVWRMDPSTGVITRPATVDYIEGIASNGVYWVGSINPGDPHPIGGMYAFADQLDRYVLADGSRVTWLYRPGKGVGLAGIDTAGHPVASVMNSTITEDLAAQLVLLLDPKTERVIITAPISFIGSLNESITDSHGIWFGSETGIYLYSDAGGLQKVSNQPGYPANGCF